MPDQREANNFSKGGNLPPFEKLVTSLTELIVFSSRNQDFWNIYNMSFVMGKPAFCICENKDADQLRCNQEADQRLCFHYIDSTIPLLPKYEISSF